MANKLKVGFIGLGNMAGAMILGLTKSEAAANGNLEIYGYDVNSSLMEKHKSNGVVSCDSVSDVIKMADYVVLAVKPQVVMNVIQDIVKVGGDENVTYISIVAGKSLDWYNKQFGTEKKILRCMPNTAALVGAAVTGVTPSTKVSEEEKKVALSIIESFGKAVVIPEHLMDAVVGVSGSAPAYVFMFIEAMADAAVAGGMPRSQAYEFAAGAVYGSAKLMIETGKHPGELKDMVCSPAGTTIEAVKVLEEKNFRGAVIDAVIAATEKSRDL